MTKLDTPTAVVPAVGTPMAGGFFGAVSRDGMWIIVSPKAEGEAALPWKTTMTASPAARSMLDGLTNTRAIADDEHPAASFCAALRISGHDDWHLGSPDDMRDVAHNMLPLAGGNPEQTTAEAFKEGGEEAFEPSAYWTSAEQDSGSAWLQFFDDGGQCISVKVWRCRVRAVRKITPFSS